MTHQTAKTSYNDLHQIVNLVFIYLLFQADSFFSLYFSNKLIETICKHTSSYAWTVIDKKQYYADKEGAWKETTPD